VLLPLVAAKLRLSCSTACADAALVLYVLPASNMPAGAKVIMFIHGIDARACMVSLFIFSHHVLHAHLKACRSAPRLGCHPCVSSKTDYWLLGPLPVSVGREYTALCEVWCFLLFGASVASAGESGR